MPLLTSDTYTGVAGRIADKYWFDKVQTGLTIKNNDTVNKITVYVADDEKTLAPQETFVFDEEFEYFHIKTKRGTASFTATTSGSLSSVKADNAQLIDDIIDWNVKDSLLYDPNNIQLAINDIVMKMTAGDKIFLSHGNYKFTGTIDLSSLPNYCYVNFEGIFTADYTGGNFPAMYLGGYGLNIFIKKIQSTITPNTTYSNIINDGICFGYPKALMNSNINIDRVVSFATGLKFAPQLLNSVTQFVQYCKINFQHIENCTYPIYFNVDNNISWVNENTFTGGRLQGYWGLYAINGADGDVGYNNNKFYNVGYEGIKNDAIYTEHFYGNFFIANRMMESIQGMYINDSHASNAQNFYLFSHVLPMTKLNITSSSSRVIATLADTGSSGWVYKGFSIDTNHIKHFDIQQWVYVIATNTNKTIPANCKYVTVATNTSAVTLTLSKDLAWEGSELTLEIPWMVNGITINNNDETVAIESGVINAEGKWSLSYRNGAWRASLIKSAGVAGVPSYSYLQAINANKTIPANCKYVTVTTDTSPVTLTIDAGAEYEGNEIIIDAAWIVNVLTINRSDASLVTTGVNRFAKWALRYKNGAWITYIVSGEIPSYSYLLAANSNQSVTQYCKWVDVSAATAPVTLTLAQNCELEGNEIIINVTDATKTITINRYNAAVAASNINCVGKWSLRWKGGQWIAYLTSTKLTAQADSTATELSGLVTDFNNLLAKLRAKNLMG